jgi:hypothetical protein
MQSRTFLVNWFCCFSFVIVWGLSGNLITAQEPDSFDIAINSILLSNEFKEDERTILHNLPISSVAQLTAMLNAESPYHIKSHRLFEFLAAKVKQYDADLPTETKRTAMAALKAKADFVGHRKALIQFLESGTAKVATEPPISDSLDNSAGSNPLPSIKLKPEPRATELPKSSAWPWIAGSISILLAVWAMIKRRP